MKKIIFACDGDNFSEAAFRFIKDMQAMEPVLVTGAFLNSLNFAPVLPGVFAVHADPVLELIEEQKEKKAASIKHFTDLCLRNDISYRIHEESLDWSIEELTKESRFADLMLISEEIFCNDLHVQQPNTFMSQVMHHAECPVICVPENYRSVDKIVVAYDGKKQSMFALKQFCSLFPQLCEKETTIVFVKETEKEVIPDLTYLEEYAAAHFKNLTFEKLHFDPARFFDSWTENQGNMLLVAGAYGRTGFSTAIKGSFVDSVISDHQVPVFIAHD